MVRALGAFRFVRFMLLALAALALGACTTQPRDEVRVNVGMQLPEPAKAHDYAALYTPYAMMATAAYTDKFALNKLNCPDPGRLAFAQEGESRGDADYRKTVRGWIGYLNARGWECRFGVYGSLPCPPRAGGEKECKPVGGLEFHVWRRMQGNNCREAVIAFRGTDKNDTGDWVSNLRWLHRLAPKFDQYAQVQTRIKQIVSRIKHNGCNGAMPFVSVGHSLGGGLAQQAAYADESGSIRYVYAFDPSPVTGFFDVSAIVLERSTKGLGVDRAYEAGEILALPRLLIDNIYPPAACRPRIRSVRFNMLAGLPGSQHSISDLTQQLHATARKPGANARRADERAKARLCKDEPLLPLRIPLPFFDQPA